MSLPETSSSPSPAPAYNLLNLNLDMVSPGSLPCTCSHTLWVGASSRGTTAVVLAFTEMLITLHFKCPFLTIMPPYWSPQGWDHVRFCFGFIPTAWSPFVHLFNSNVLNTHECARHFSRCRSYGSDSDREISCPPGASILVGERKQTSKKILKTDHFSDSKCDKQNKSG